MKQCRHFLKVKENIFQILFIVSLGFLIYSNTIVIDTFHYDDDLTIIENASIRDISNLGNIFYNFKTRFIPGVTFALNYAYAGLRPESYHAVNCVIHILSSLLVWVLVQSLLKIYPLPVSCPSGISRIFALGASLMFLSHPTQTEAVNFVTQRYMLLASFFYLATLTLYIKSKIQKNHLFYFLSILTTALAMLSKEISFSLPFMLIAIEFLFFPDGTVDKYPSAVLSPRSFLRRPTRTSPRSLINALSSIFQQSPGNRRSSRRMSLLRAGPFFLALLIIPLTLKSTTPDMPGTSRVAHISVDPNQGSVQVDITKAASSFSRGEYFLTQLNVMNTYLRLLLLPVNQNIDYDYPIYKSAYNIKTIFSLSVLLFLVFIAYKLFYKHRLLSFGIFWFFLTLSVESTIIPIAHVIAEYRLYLAMVGFSVFSVGLFAHRARSQKFFFSVMVITIGVFSLTSHLRNNVWGSRVSLWEDTVKKSPNKARPYINLGRIYTQQKRYDDAVNHFLRAIELDPNNPRNVEAYTNLGVVYVKMGKVKKAMELHQKAIKLNPSNYLPYFNLAIAFSKVGRFDQEIEYYMKALKLNPHHEDILYSLGLAYIDNGDLRSAFLQSEKLRSLGYQDLSLSLKKLVEKKLIF